MYENFGLFIDGEWTDSDSGQTFEEDGKKYALIPWWP